MINPNKRSIFVASNIPYILSEDSIVSKKSVYACAGLLPDLRVDIPLLPFEE
jgi:hypothetical protein